ncbi:OmpA family protein [Paraburkholderia sp. Tr-20389]|uniref:OmpA/MotB family protein n=1 Tax=Paraburkholderia sp. Tr-20389 TaxID=2703903 RepID=UPI00197FCE66|nr:OmpA family protein [Paraburkholderia sp. Tr-20389]MBN3757448.1 OmpA family protein [Paraburkholderia sp. Tr-20389]
MKEKPSEWIAISDLMAGVMAVVMLMLVVAVVQKSTSEARYREELANAKSSKGDPLAKMMQSLSAKVGTGDAAGLMALDRNTNRLTLRDGVFERGSACLTPDARAAVEAVQSQLAHFVVDNPHARILVEGYTDNLPVNRPVIDYQRFCTVYDDNFTLSAARAREARRALIGTIDEVAARRIVVAGYGESRPLQGLDPADPKNRRVEVQFLVDQ